MYRLAAFLFFLLPFIGCANEVTQPTRPATSAVATPWNAGAPAALAGVTTPLTLDSMVTAALGKVAVGQGQGAADALAAQRDALVAAIKAADTAGNVSLGNQKRAELRAWSLNLVLATFSNAYVPYVIASVEAAIADLETRAATFKASGLNVALTESIIGAAKNLLALAKGAATPTLGLDYGAQAGYAVIYGREKLPVASPLPPPPPPPPSGIGLWSTIEAPTPWNYSPTYPSQSACAGAGVTYDVGPGKPYLTPAAVPWLALRPCDNVMIHWRPMPYKDAILLSNRGAANKFIRVVGVAGPSGERPVFDGQGAAFASAIPFFNPILEAMGMITVSPPTGYTYGFKPGYIEIANIEIRNASPKFGYTRRNGQAAMWGKFAAGIYIERAEHVTIRNCDIHDNGNGIFQNSKFGEAAQSRDLLVERNYIHDNGNPMSASEHNAYTEGVGTVYQFNTFGQPVGNTAGDNIKDRSVGVTFRYNYIEGGAHLIALRDPQSNLDHERVQRDTWGDLLVNAAYIYGNVMVMRERPGFPGSGTGTAVAYGDGNYSWGNVRGGTLHFYNNTVVSKFDKGIWTKMATPIFEVINPLPAPVVSMRNNVLLAVSATPGKTPTPFAMFFHYGNADFTHNWISSGWLKTEPGNHPVGNVLSPGERWNGSGVGTTLTNAQNAPGLVDWVQGNFHLTAGSPLIGAGAPLHPDVVKTGNAPLFEWSAAFLSIPHSPASPISIGAFEY
jgi:hypothetical protein